MYQQVHVVMMNFADTTKGHCAKLPRLLSLALRWDCLLHQGSSPVLHPAET